MRKQGIIFLIYVLMIILLSPAIMVEAQAKPKLSAKSKTMTVGQSYRLKLEKVPSDAGVKWRTSKKSVVSITENEGNTVTLKAEKKGTAILTAKYKKKIYKCKITVKAEKQVVDSPVLNSTDVTLYHLSNPDEKEFPYDKNHIREYRFRVSGTKKEVSKWEVVGENADYFTITSYGLVTTLWGPTYVEPCVTATVVATLEDGRTLQATVRAYSELNIYIDSVFDSFERQYITSDMTQKEKVEKAAWYIGATSDYAAQDSEWYHIFTLHKGTGEEDDPLSLHLYTYCENDGVNNFDPSGHWSISKKYGRTHQKITWEALKLVGVDTCAKKFNVSTIMKYCTFPDRAKVGVREKGWNNQVILGMVIASKKDNGKMDKSAVGRWHGRELEGLNNLKRDVFRLIKSTPGYKDDKSKLLGCVLHAIEDWYAHSYKEEMELHKYMKKFKMYKNVLSKYSAGSQGVIFHQDRIQETGTKKKVRQIPIDRDIHGNTKDNINKDFEETKGKEKELKWDFVEKNNPFVNNERVKRALSDCIDYLGEVL